MSTNRSLYFDLTDKLHYAGVSEKSCLKIMFLKRIYGMAIYTTFFVRPKTKSKKSLPYSKGPIS